MGLEERARKLAKQRQHEQRRLADQQVASESARRATIKGIRRIGRKYVDLAKRYGVSPVLVQRQWNTWEFPPGMGNITVRSMPSVPAWVILRPVLRAHIEDLPESGIAITAKGWPYYFEHPYNGQSVFVHTGWFSIKKWKRLADESAACIVSRRPLPDSVWEFLRSE